MKKAVMSLTFLACSAVLFGQQVKNPVSTVVQEILPRQQKNLLAAVDEMPADKFGFRPTPPQMSFADLVIHMTESNVSLCSKIGNVPPPRMPNTKSTDPKDRLLDGLKRSFDFCTFALSKLDDSKLGDTIEVYGGKEGPRAFAVIALTNDWADHYSAAAMYLRLNGLLPPTAKK
jgi:hypothetical protein